MPFDFCGDSGSYAGGCLRTPALLHFNLDTNRLYFTVRTTLYLGSTDTGHPRFFLGTDSAPHPSHKKEGPDSCAGVYTTPLVLPYLATILESFGALDRLKGFACDFGRQFYEVKDEKWVGQVKLVR